MVEDRVARFEAVLAEHDAGLRAFVYRLVGSDVDDVLQDAYLAAFRALPAFRGEAALRTWLHRIAYTTALNALRSRSRRLQRDDRNVLAGGVDEAATAAHRVDLERALAKLTVEARSVLILVDAQGFSYDEVAQVLGVAAGTVASRLHRARERVRAAMQEGERAHGR